MWLNTSNISRTTVRLLRTAEMCWKPNILRYLLVLVLPPNRYLTSLIRKKIASKMFCNGRRVPCICVRYLVILCTVAKLTYNAFCEFHFFLKVLKKQSFHFSNLHLVVQELDKQWNNLFSFKELTGQRQQISNVMGHASFLWKFFLKFRVICLFVDLIAF